MSDNYTLISSPKLWASAHKPIKFVYEMPYQEAANIENANGYINVLLSSPLAGGKTIVVGDLIFIYADSDKDSGYHVVKSVSSNLDFVLDSSFVNNNLVVVKYATPPIWAIYKGYLPSEANPNAFPFKKVADISPEPNAEGYLEIDVMGFVKAAMKEIQQPLEGSSVGGSGDFFYYSDVNLWMPYRLMIGLDERHLYFEQIYLALNSSIENDVLNAEYLNTNKPLNSLPFFNSCGATWLSYLSNFGVGVVRYDNGGASTLTGFNDDFNNDFFKT